jgi:hypothetical protein
MKFEAAPRSDVSTSGPEHSTWYCLRIIPRGIPNSLSSNENENPEPAKKIYGSSSKKNIRTGKRKKADRI